MLAEPFSMTENELQTTPQSQCSLNGSSFQSTFVSFSISSHYYPHHYHHCYRRSMR